MENNFLFKILNNTNKPYIFLDFLHNKGYLEKILPELHDLNISEKGYKNNFHHTLNVLKNVCDKNLDIKQKLVAVFHDIGKSKARKININNKWTFHNHEKIGAEMTLSILDRWNIKDLFIKYYLYRMIYYHGRIKMHTDVSEAAIRRLIKDVGSDIIFDLIEFCKCDITTKYDEKRNRIIIGLDTIKNRIIEIIKKDNEPIWKSPLSGNVIMELLNIGECKLIGDIKKKYDPLLKSGEISIETAKEEILLNYILIEKNNLIF
jgi:poly(A) polymerase